ncbi:MAG: PadR family transcriptional regulator, partial [Nanoarchaeota archaeon]|nr:PadR family transcriptional regulator [Nanoarchaeota archaeon]
RVGKEKYLTENFKNHSILCTYDISKLNPNTIKDLVKGHDKLILSTDTATILSSKTLSNKELMNSKLIDEFVKRELKTIVLALITKQPQCGREIQMEIYKNFGILLSSGTLYPLLHELEQNKLLECNSGIKTKTYMPADERRIRKMINEHIQAKNFLNNFLQTTMIREE